MFIELADLLRCPQPHPEAHLVVATGEMIGRSIMRGVVGCPSCHAEYRISQGVCRFGAADAAESAERSAVPEAQAIQALLFLSSPGGYVALVGSAARAASGLVALLGGVHLVGINAPPDVAQGPMLSLLESPDTLPLRTASVRGVVIGSERAGAPWLAEGARVLLPGLRLVVLSDDASVEGVERMATGPGVWVGQKKGAGRTAHGER